MMRPRILRERVVTRNKREAARVENTVRPQAAREKLSRMPIAKIPKMGNRISALEGGFFKMLTNMKMKGSTK
ncbi:MAG TPA: hypothetical protein DCS30_07865 [Rhizobiales bacterium]|nr:hypothetical protein [Hyphomicrobiales bacterium]